MGYHGSFADKVRKLMNDLGKNGQDVKVSDVAKALNLITHKEKVPLRNSIKDLLLSGDIARVDTGTYVWIGKVKGAPQKQEVMWRTLRARKIVTLEDLMEFSSASEYYAREWLRMLMRNEIIKKVAGGKYKLIKDDVAMPVDSKKAKKLRDIRARKALARLDDAATAINEARKMIHDLNCK